jgi:hypothetical protein
VDPLVALARGLRERGVRFVVIGVAGANITHWMPARCSRRKIAISFFLSIQTISCSAGRRVKPSAASCGAIRIPSICRAVDDVDIPVARLLHIVESEHAVGRDNDRLFLAAHREALLEPMKHESRD